MGEGRVRVTLVRHGEAGDDARHDEERSLTERGRADTRRVGRTLARRGTRFGAVVTSPLVRAVQTAEIIAAATGYRGRVTITRALEPEAPAAAVVELLGTVDDAKSIALVAHEPILSRVAALLTGAKSFPALRKSEVLRIRLSDEAGSESAANAGRGVVRWRIDPDTGKRHRA
jgi:phosphohistidine phosphatase